MNAHDSVIDAVLTLLRQSPAVTAGPIEEDVDALDLPEGAGEGVSVTLVQSTPQATVMHGSPVDWSTVIAVECAARADGRSAAGRASRALHAKVYARLMSNPSLGGVASIIDEPQIRGERAQFETRIGQTTGLYTVRHRTATATLEV